MGDVEGSGFNVASDPWLDVVFLDGSRETVSTSRVLREADTIAGLDESDPMTRSALLQHLLGLVYSAVGSPGGEEFRTGGRPDLGRVADWVTANEARFGLFDPVAPFGQNPALVGLVDEPGAVGPVHGLLWESAKRRSPLKAGFTFADEVALPAAAAARLVVARQAFSMGGLWSFPRKTARWGPSVRSWPMSNRWGAPIVHLVGSTLAATLSLNWVPGPAGQVNLTWSDHHDDGQGSPWPGGKAPARFPSGIADLSTWLSRNVLLLPDSDGLVRRMVMTAGDKAPEPTAELMPHALYTDRGVVRIFPPQAGRRPWRLWRSLAEILPMAAVDGGAGTGLLGFHAARTASRAPDPVRVEVSGMSASPVGSPMHAAIHESVLLPPPARWPAIGAAVTDTTTAVRKTMWQSASRVTRTASPSGQVAPGMLTGLDRAIDVAAVAVLEQSIDIPGFLAAVAAATTSATGEIVGRYSAAGQWAAAAAATTTTTTTRSKGRARS